MPVTPDAYAQAYIDNADYAAEGDRTKALAFETAVRRLLFVQPRVMQKAGGSRVEHDPQQLRDELVSVQSWLSQNPAGDDSPDVILPDFTGFRGGM